MEQISLWAATSNRKLVVGVKTSVCSGKDDKTRRSMPFNFM